MAVSGQGLSGLRVLVTGGLGFIGSNLAHACTGLGAVMTIFDSLDRRCGGNLANIDGIADRVRVVREDIRSARPLAAAMEGQDLVFNCAAYTSHAGSFDDPLAYIEVNCSALVGLLEAARAMPRPPRIVQLGTSTQIGRTTRQIVTEDDVELPTDVYSATKTAAEKLVLAYAQRFGLPVTVIRLANVYGPRAKITDPGLGFINYFIGLALRGADLTVYGAGDQLRSATFVGDATDALIQAALSPATVGKVMFAASEEQRTVRDIAERIVSQVGRGRIRSVEWPRERTAIEVGDVPVSSARIRELVGWRAMTELDTGIAKTRDYYTTRLEAYLT